MSSRVFFKSNQGTKGAFSKIIIAVVSGLLGLGLITGCGNNSSGLQVPKDFIQDFIAKHETMIDQSLVYYYVKEEQPEVAQKIAAAIRTNKAKGALETLEQATFDFSGLQILVIDKKEEYVNDEPVVFVKVSVTGKYLMELPEASKSIEANEVIVLQMARHEWKVTENHNPWS